MSRDEEEGEMKHEENRYKLCHKKKSILADKKKNHGCIHKLMNCSLLKYCYILYI